MANAHANDRAEPQYYVAVSSTLLVAWSLSGLVLPGVATAAGLTLILINIMKTNSGIDTALFLVDEQGVVEETKIGQNHKEVDWQWWAFGD